MKRYAVVLWVAMLGIAACGSSSDSPPTSQGLATKLKDANLCRSVRPASKAALPGGWECVGPKDPKASPAYVWGFKTTNTARANEADFQNTSCRGTREALQHVKDLTNDPTPVVLGAFPAAEGKTWFAISKASFLGQVADALGGKVVTHPAPC